MGRAASGLRIRASTYRKYASTQILSPSLHLGIFERKLSGEDRYFHMVRRKTRQIKVGNVLIGGNAPVVVQSMTNTDTSDVSATVGQIKRLEGAGGGKGPGA